MAAQRNGRNGQATEDPAHGEAAVHDLACPFCGTSVRLQPRDLVDGGSVQCPHCREEALILCERVEHSDRYHWTLIEPETDDERR